jgi:hypothetical protein
MKEAVVREKLLEICEAISAPREGKSKPGDTAEGLYVAEGDTEISHVIDQLRMQIKYLMFDLEASRRENRYLRQMLEMRPPQSRRERGEEDDGTWK